MKFTTRRDIAARVARTTGISEQDCYTILSASIDGMIDELQSGHSIIFRGLGTFEVVIKRKRLARARSKGSSKFDPDLIVEIPKRMGVSFRPVRSLKLSVARLAVE